MGIAKLYGQKASGADINGIIKDYHVYAGENISAGDLVEFINGLSGYTSETTSDTVIRNSAYDGFSLYAVALDENRVFVVHSNSSNYYLYGVVLTINNSKISKGTDTQLCTTANTGRIFVPRRLSDGKIFIAYARVSNSYKLYGMLVTISGTTPAVLDDRTLSNKGNDGVGIDVTVTYDANGNEYIFVTHSALDYCRLYGIVCSIIKDSNTITYGTNTELLGDYTGYVISTTPITYDNTACGGKYLIAHSSSSNYYLSAIVCTVVGTTITKGTDTQFSTESKTGNVISTESLSNGDVLVVHSDSGERVAAKVLSVVGTTITQKYQKDSLISAYYSGRTISTQLLENDRVFIAHTYGGSSKDYLHGVIITCTGTEITVGTDTVLSSADYSGYKTSSLLLDSVNIFIAHSYSANYHLYAQMWSVDEVNNIPVNQVRIAQYETQVRKTTTTQFDGVAKTRGVGGTTTAPKDYVSIYTL